MAELDWHAERGDLEGLTLLDRSPEDEGIDLVAVRAWRRSRVRAEMAVHGIDAVILSDPVSIRYATGARNMQVFSMRNAPARYLVLTADRSILYEFTGCAHLADGLRRSTRCCRPTAASSPPDRASPSESAVGPSAWRR